VQLPRGTEILTVRRQLGVLIAVVLAASVAAPQASAGSGRKARRQALDAELASFEQALAATAPVRSFCERSLVAVNRRFEALRSEIRQQPARELDLDDAVAQLQELRNELERETTRCRASAEQAVARAVAGLEEAVAEARERTYSASAPAAAAPNPHLAECDELLRELLPSMRAESRYQEAISTARDAVRRLEHSVTGGSCEDDFGRAEFHYGTGSFEEAVKLYCRLATTACLDRAWCERASGRLQQLAARVERALDPEGAAGAGPKAASLPLPDDRLGAVASALAECQPERYGELAERVGEEARRRRDRAEARAAEARAAAEQPPPAAPAEESSAPGHAVADPVLPQLERGRSAAAAVAPSYLALDVWQSAWGDFAEIDDLVAYLRRNHITEVFLNPGQAMKPELEEEGYAQLLPLVRALRAGGVEHISYLYAELGYQVGHYARFLKRHPDLGIDFLIDDSEFTDRHRARFETNRDTVRAQGIGYAAFVTVEAFGNSGVSDGTRRWAIRNLDQTILMSYFSCTLEGQKSDLDAYLAYADRIGKRGSVKIALLMGGKKVGRERSCERELDRVAFQSFLRDLHAWARTHPSYAGIVLETNRRLPSYDVAKAPLR
jgi:hypothetical protein